MLIGSSDKASLYPVNGSRLMKALRVLSKILPGDYLKTAFYLNFINKPRNLLRLALNTFYRMDHVYAVLNEFKRDYRGNFSILEFGTSDGYAFTKMLYATRYLGMADRVLVHTFDSFRGMPAPQGERDRDLVSRNDWVEGEFRGRYEELAEYCAQHYQNYQIHKGFFEQTLTREFLESLRVHQPILVWFDCDYYSSARVVWERLMDYLPNGCVIYFDEYEQLNFGSRFTGEARLVYEVNRGCFGEDVELVLDSRLSLDTKRIYRFVRFQPNNRYEQLFQDHSAEMVHYRTNDSPLP
jgi:macrocin-O-methyltransferase TylF-like protien